jgi:hypothetical protein
MDDFEQWWLNTGQYVDWHDYFLEGSVYDAIDALQIESPTTQLRVLSDDWNPADRFVADGTEATPTQRL